MKESIREVFADLKVSDEVIDRTEQLLNIQGLSTYLAGFEKGLKAVFRMKSLDDDQKATLEFMRSLSKKEVNLINKAIEEEKEFLKGRRRM